MAYFYYAGKRIFYTESGSGIPCVFLHGNTASSKMFQFILPLYEQTMGIVLLDFLGNGKSERVCRFPDELWIDQGMQVVTLCKALGYPKVNLVGTSGGAYAAINAALAAPELFTRWWRTALMEASWRRAFPKPFCRNVSLPKGTRRRGVFTNGARGKIGSGSWIWTRRRW